MSDNFFPIKWLADSRITFTDPGSGLTMDITIVETESDVDRCVITKAIVHSVSGPKVHKLPEGWSYEVTRDVAWRILYANFPEDTITQDIEWRNTMLDMLVEGNENVKNLIEDYENKHE